MSTPMVIGIVVVALIAILILRSRFRKQVAAHIPHVTYVDETLLDLIRTNQTSAAIRYYEENAAVTAGEAEKVVRYFLGRAESLMLLVRLQGQNQAPLFTDDTLLDFINQGRLNKAALYYVQQTGADPREAQVAINALAVNPDMAFLPRKNTSA